ncbi:hypothetical protein GOBAR_AA02735 [Gossypium barbadense]|uniref:Exostosin GT47 domain-containing protein n=1 Tax=Gossypium barbadense TaxID=3634 RepID=A0A2P5YQI1_GOSBA|nr:hypothetical protein GOBAR_AA02735 [Gossypium barbadense]
MLEVIFHDRMKKYKCLTNDSLVASAIFVPYYAGLDLRRYLWGFNTSMRDSSGFDLINWLKQKPQWKTMWGKDHFLVSSRIARDFRRKSDRKSDWGSNFRFLPESKNLSMLTIESGPWENDIAVPYPTSFHPSSDYQVLQWQNPMRTQNRPYLFSFAGASRTRQKNSTRKEIIRHCQSSNKLCKLLDCNSVGHECDDPLKLMNLFRSSIFCLQPPGDSLTRRSTFDSILAGCIPVFFHPGSAYTQYLWYLPKNYSNYSVFISANDLKLGKVRIEEKLVTVSKDEVASMREEVIRLIPRIIYGDRRSGLESVEDDAFDLAIEGVLKRVDRLRGRSAYTQYLWYLPKNYSNYSVFISANDLKLGKVRIEEKLVTVSKDEVASMREEVIRLIPRIIYGDRRSGLESVEDDAFDLAIEGVLKRVDRLRGSDL